LTIEDEQEWKLYQKIRDILWESAKRITKPKFVVYLRAGEETLYPRVNNKNITKDYLGRLTTLYDRYFFHYKASPVLIIDVNNVDFVREPQPVATIINSIKKAIETPPMQNTYIKLDDL